MGTTNLSIGHNPVLDFDCSGWLDQSRSSLMQAVQGITGVTRVNGAGISTVRITYDPAAVTPADLMSKVTEQADTILPGYGFANR